MPCCWGELVLMGLIILLSIRHRKYPIILLSAGQTLLVAWSELTDPVSPAAHMRVDGLAMLLCIIAAFVGGFICIYAVGYMKAYHQHHEGLHRPQRLFLLDAVPFPGGHVRAGAV